MKTTKFIYSDTEVFIHTFDDDNVMEKLKPAIYQLKFSKFTGYYLTIVSDNFEVPGEIYGSTDRRVEKVLTTYHERDISTGVLLSGDKGSGKTMTASLICNQLIESGVPVILINEPHSGSGFLEFLSDIGEAVLFFDEFGKTYKENKQGDSNSASQDDLLSLFDGTHSCKRLILLTENETRYINSFMINRPGRIYYHFKHDKLDEDTVVEYCEKQDVPVDVIKQIKSVRNKTITFSFDILVAIVAEWKRFGDTEETIEKLIVDLNVPHGSDDITCMVIDEIKDTTTGEKLFVHEDDRQTRYQVPDSENRVGSIDYFESEEASKDENGNYNYDNEMTYSIGISDVVDKTMDTIIFFNKHRSHAFKFKIIRPTYSRYNPSAF